MERPMNSLFGFGSCGRSFIWKSAVMQFKKANALNEKQDFNSRQVRKEIWKTETILADSFWGEFKGVESFEDIQANKEKYYPKAVVRLFKMGNGLGARKDKDRGEYIVGQFLPKLKENVPTWRSNRVTFGTGLYGATGTSMLMPAAKLFDEFQKDAFGILVIPPPEEDAWHFDNIVKPALEEFQALAKSKKWNYIKIYPGVLFKSSMSATLMENIYEKINYNIALGLQGILNMFDLTDPSNLGRVLGDGGPLRIGSFVLNQIVTEQEIKEAKKEAVEKIARAIKQSLTNRSHYLGQKESLAETMILLHGPVLYKHLQLVKNALAKLQGDKAWMAVHPKFHWQTEQFGIPAGDLTVTCMTSTNVVKAPDRDEIIDYPWLKVASEKSGVIELLPSGGEEEKEENATNETLFLTALEPEESKVEEIEQESPADLEAKNPDNGHYNAGKQETIPPHKAAKEQEEKENPSKASIWEKAAARWQSAKKRTGGFFNRMKIRKKSKKENSSDFGLAGGMIVSIKKESPNPDDRPKHTYTPPSGDRFFNTRLAMIRQQEKEEKDKGKEQKRNQRPAVEIRLRRDN